MRSDNPWKVVSTKTVYQNPWMRIREDTVITPTGEDGIYGLMESSDSVIVTVLNDKNELYLIRAFSYPAASWNWELPGGQDVSEASAIFLFPAQKRFLMNKSTRQSSCL